MLTHPDTDTQTTCKEESLGKAAKALTVLPVWKAHLPHRWPLQFTGEEHCLLSSARLNPYWKPIEQMVSLRTSSCTPEILTM